MPSRCESCGEVAGNGKRFCAECIRCVNSAYKLDQQIRGMVRHSRKKLSPDRLALSSRKLEAGQQTANIPIGYFNALVTGAVQRDLEFLVSIEYLQTLLESQEFRCALSGVPISIGPAVGSAKTASVDRIDSSKGYIVGNVQWVHKNINNSKWHFNQDSFLRMCAVITEYQREKAIRAWIKDGI